VGAIKEASGSALLSSGVNLLGILSVGGAKRRIPKAWREEDKEGSGIGLAPPQKMNFLLEMVCFGVF